MLFEGRMDRASWGTGEASMRSSGLSEGRIDGRAFSDDHGCVVLGLAAQRRQLGIKRSSELALEGWQGLQRGAPRLLLSNSLDEVLLGLEQRTQSIFVLNFVVHSEVRRFLG